MIPEARLEGRRLVLRPWHPELAPLMREALTAAWHDLQRWIPWVFPELEDIPALEARLEQYRKDFHDGGNALYAILNTDETEVWGGAGLYRRVGPGALEIGYWVRSDRAGQGIATEASALLVDAGFALEGIRRLEIRCDPDHVASAVIPRKLGFVHRETMTGKPESEGGDGRDTMVWVLEAPVA